MIKVMIVRFLGDIFVLSGHRDIKRIEINNEII